MIGKITFPYFVPLPSYFIDAGVVLVLIQVCYVLFGCFAAFTESSWQLYFVSFLSISSLQ